MVLVIVGSYLAYAFIYRGRNEPPTKRKTTNQEAAYYTLVLCQDLVQVKIRNFSLF